MFSCASEVKNLGYPPPAFSVESPPFRKPSMGHPAEEIFYLDPDGKPGTDGGVHP